MKAALTFAYYPDAAIEDLGEMDVTRALLKFDQFPWAELVRKSRDIYMEKGECIYADLTFLIGKQHIMTRIRDDEQSFDIEVCVMRPKKLLGIFDCPKFYEIENVSFHGARAAIQVFYERSGAEQHAYFDDLMMPRKKQK